MNANKSYDQRVRKQLALGREEGLRSAILQVCAARALKLTAAQQARVGARHTPDTLLRWLSRATKASTAAEIFVRLPRTKRSAPGDARRRSK
jgi:hypothetical protein